MTSIIYKLIILLKVGPSVIIVGYPNEKAFRPEVYITIGWKKNVIGIGKWSGVKKKQGWRWQHKWVEKFNKYLVNEKLFVRKKNYLKSYNLGGLIKISS